MRQTDDREKAAAADGGLRAAGPAGGGPTSEDQPNPVHTTLLYHFCRLRLPAVALPFAAFTRHLRRAFELYRAKRARAGEGASWGAFLENLHALDWFLACACLEGQPGAWEALFNARASRTESLLVDALRVRAVRLFPR